MGSLRIKNKVIKEFIGETLGTFLLVLVADCSIAAQVLYKPDNVNFMAIAFGVGMGLMLAFFTCFRLSGSHVNPVVTLGLISVGKVPIWKLLHYSVAQLLGGFLASAVAYLNYYPAINHLDQINNGTNIALAGILTTFPAGFLPLSGVTFDAIISCALLMIGILAIIDSKNLNCSRSLASVSFFVLLGGLIVSFSLNSGPVINPARDIPGRLFAYMVGYGSEIWSPSSGFYWIIGGVIAPLLGGVIGSWIYYFLVEIHLDDELPTEKIECVTYKYGSN